MTTLVLDAGPSGVTAALVDADGTLAATAYADVAAAGDRSEVATDELWRATLAAVREVVDGAGPRPDRVAVTTDPVATVLWDRETLGSPRPAVLLRAADALPRVAADEPHTWALLEEGRYAVGTLESYLVARLTLGTWHVTDPTHAAATGLLDDGRADWSAAACGRVGVPVEALPEVVPSSGRLATTEARAFVGLALPVTALVAHDGTPPAERLLVVAALARTTSP